MKRSARKKRRVVRKTYADPLPFRDVLPIIAQHCDMQSFARLKRVCKEFREWLPEEHPAIAMIYAGYGGCESEFPYHAVSLVFDAYFRRFVDHFPKVARQHIHLRTESQAEDGEIGVMRSDGGIWDCNGCTSLHIFEDAPWQYARILGRYNIDGTCKSVLHMMMGNHELDA
jgi:hypothetical protein